MAMAMAMAVLEVLSGGKRYHTFTFFAFFIVRGRHCNFFVPNVES